MNITLLIESLGSGGAERQICTLAAEFQRRGHKVCVVRYADGDFFLPVLIAAGVEHVRLPGKSRLSWIRWVRVFLRSRRQDVVLAYLSGPSAYAELASLPSRRWGLVVSERVAIPNSHKKRWDLHNLLHRLSDYVVTNSHVNRLMLEKAQPKLRGRLLTIYNAVDLNHFSPRQRSSRNPDVLRLVVASTYQARKNMLGLIMALDLLRQTTPELHLHVDWFGDVVGDPSDFDEAVRSVSDLGLDGYIRFNPATSNIVDEYRACDAVLLASFFEGLPNTICEAMACGRPVLMSAVCDAGNLVKDGVNGFLFDPAAPSSIAEAIRKFAQLTQEQRDVLGFNSRNMAESLFNIEQISDQYLRILSAAATKEELAIDNAKANVPETARKMITH